MTYDLYHLIEKYPKHHKKQKKTRYINFPDSISLPLSLSPFGLSAEGPCEQAAKYEVGSSRLGDRSFQDSTRDPR